ncbi:MAG: radical SAM protein [Planctomycetaceae bacterium]|jgi:wyosine [tRNA(Phe)-imidazoG37] synthetase (radical SAM superfamily)|nr:radical SAM protein [Planctomycetaceae bacterium]
MISSLVQYHPRSFREFCYVYPVVSRRSGGLSLGVNLSLSGQCTFSCVYCQVIAEGGQKQIDVNSDFIDFDDLKSELCQLIGMINNGSLFQDSWFSLLPVEKRGLKDIAFSGDGEPTLSSAFPEAVRCVAAVRRQLCNEAVKIVLITNGTMLHTKHVQNAIESMLENNGEIWAKLDAGTPEYFQTIARSSIKYEKILDNLTTLTKRFPAVIQSCFISIQGQPPDNSEIKQYAQRLMSLQTNNILRIQIYTTARNTPEQWVSPLNNEQLDSIAETVRNLTGLQVDTFYSN